MTDEQRRRILRCVDQWKFWMVIAYFALAVFVVALAIVYGRANHAEAEQVAQRQAANATKVQTCYSSVKSLPVVDGFVRSQRQLIDSQILATEQALAVSAPDDPIRAVRLASIHRLRQGLRRNDALEALVNKSTPTRKQCDELAAALMVSIPGTTPAVTTTRR